MKVNKTLVKRRTSGGKKERVNEGRREKSEGKKMIEREKQMISNHKKKVEVFCPNFCDKKNSRLVSRTSKFFDKN